MQVHNQLIGKLLRSNLIIILYLYFITTLFEFFCSKRWHRKNNRDESIETDSISSRIFVRHGILTITSVKKTDAGTYFCTAANSEGSETLEVQLSVTAPLTVHIQPARQTIDLGKSAELSCSVTGFPHTSVTWLKDGQPLRTGSRVRLLSKEHIKITSVSKEDRGMYQCFVRNDHDAVQATAEIKLGGTFS